MKKLIPIALALVAATAMFPAAAHAKQLKTTVELEIYGEIESSGAVSYYFFGEARPKGFPSFPGIFGRSRAVLKPVKIDEDALICASRRDVQIFRDEPEAADILIGTARTRFASFGGEIGLPPGQVPGTYYAQVSEEVYKAGHGKRLKCLGGTSPPLTVQPPNFG
jgi:hypothetical protein